MKSEFGPSSSGRVTNSQAPRESQFLVERAACSGIIREGVDYPYVVWVESFPMESDPRRSDLICGGKVWRVVESPHPFGGYGRCVCEHRGHFIE